MPRIAFMGVRISWLTFARNSSLAWLAASAASFVRHSSSSNCLRLGDVIDEPGDTIYLASGVLQRKGATAHPADRAIGAGDAEMRLGGYAMVLLLKVLKNQIEILGMDALDP